jgi:hypothetical protein
MNQEEFTRAFLVALKCKEVQESLSNVVTQGLKNEIVVLRGELKKRDVSIGQLKTQVQELREENDRLEQYTRRNSIRITNVPEKKNEDVTKTVLDLINNLPLSPPLNLSEIDRLHRVGKPPTPTTTPPAEASSTQEQTPSKTKKRPRAILIKFATYRSRKRVMDMKATRRESQSQQRGLVQ